MKVSIFYCTAHPKLLVWKIEKNGERVVIPNSGYIRRLFVRHQRGELKLKLLSRKCPKCSVN